MPRVAYTAEVTQEARKSADEIARGLDELFGDRLEQWVLIIRESFDDPDLRVHLRREHGGKEPSFDFRFHGAPDLEVEPVMRQLRAELERAGILRVHQSGV